MTRRSDSEKDNRSSQHLVDILHLGLISYNMTQTLKNPGGSRLRHALTLLCITGSQMFQQPHTIPYPFLYIPRLWEPRKVGFGDHWEGLYGKTFQNFF